MPQFIGDGATFNFNANPSDWPTLSCNQANLLALLNSDLQLDAARSVRLQGSGQVSFQSDGQISAQGALSLRTGGSPTERVRVLADGKVGIGTNAPDATLHVVGDTRTDGALRVTGDAEVSGALRAISNLSIGALGTPAARLIPNPTGGLRITVPNTTDEVRLATESDGSFAHLDLQATLATARGNLSVNGNLNVAGIIQGVLAANAIGSSQLANGAVITAKIADKAVTLGKIADGVLPPAIGIAVQTGMQHGQSIPVPSGFTRAECVFFVALKFLIVDPNNQRTIYNCTADGQGKVSITPDGSAVAVGVALAKKGGW